MDELVSIVVPVYNADHTFALLLDSLFNQSYQNIEYIFVDDCSTNNCISMVAAEVEKYPFRKKAIKVLSHNKNQGISSSRNSGLLAAQGEYIQFADQDDLLDRGMVHQLYQMITRYNADVAICGFSRESVADLIDRAAINVRLLRSDDCMKSALYGGTGALLWNKMFRRELFINNDVNAPVGMTMLEDLHVMYRVFYYANVVVGCDNTYYHWRNNPASASHHYQKKINVQAPKLIDAIDRLELFFDVNNINEVGLIKAMISHEVRVLIDLALYGELSFLEKNRVKFKRVGYNSILHDSGFAWYTKLVALSFKYRVYPVLYLLRICSRIHSILLSR